MILSTEGFGKLEWKNMMIKKEEKKIKYWKEVSFFLLFKNHLMNLIVFYDRPVFFLFLVEDLRVVKMLN